MAGALTMAQAAAECGLSRERFRKVWLRWNRELNFPAPFRRPGLGGGTFAWDRDAVRTWKEHRQAALGQAAPAANEDMPPPARGSRLARQIHRERSELRRMMMGGQG